MSNGVRRISNLAADQWGLVTTRQAANLGVSRVHLARLADRGVLQRLLHGVYLATSTPNDDATMLRAIWLSLDPSPTAIERIATPHEAGVVSLSSAASLHQMGDLPTYQHHLTFPLRKQTRRDDLVLHQGRLDRDDVVLVGGLPCTTPERTIADLLYAGHELEHVAQALRDGLMQGKVTLQLLLKTLECTQRRKGQAGTISAYRQLDTLMAAAGVDAASVAEQIAATELGRSIAFKVLSDSGRLELLSQLEGDFFDREAPVSVPAAMVQQLAGFVTALPRGRMPGSGS